jgi:GNAT superfamily N-acetyltransferase
MIWQRVNDKNFSIAFDFLMNNEIASISVLNRLVNECNGQEAYSVPQRRNASLFILEYNNNVLAAALISRNGLLLPVFAKLNSDYAAEMLIRQIRSIRQPVNSVMAMTKDANLVARHLANKPHTGIEYYYMINRYPDKHKAEPKPSSPANSADIRISQCTVLDCDKLFELHKAYELEEVLLDISTFKPDFSYMYLKKILADEIVYMLEYKGEIVAKCNSNARSPGYMQIGGMFTKKEFRGRGFGTLVLDKLMKHAALMKKHSALFVKKNNKTALRLYEKTGFSHIDEYSILYC